MNTDISLVLTTAIQMTQPPFIAFIANPITKELFIYDEHYETKMLNSDIADMIKRKGYTKERIRADSAEPKSNDDLRRLGISRIAPSIKGKDSIINGITAIQEYKIYVLPNCKNTIMELIELYLENR